MVNNNSYNEVINDLNNVDAKIDNIETFIANSNSKINSAKLNNKIAAITAVSSLITNIILVAYRLPIQIAFILFGVTAISANWSLASVSYINSEKVKIDNLIKKKGFFLKRKYKLEEEKRRIEIEINNNATLYEINIQKNLSNNEIINTDLEKKSKTRIKSINI